MTRKKNSLPVLHPDTENLLGYVSEDTSSWQALTVFGYQIARTETKQAAQEILLKEGVSFLQGTWQYYDKDDKNWFPCVIKEALENKVIVNRSTELGYLDPDDFKQVIIENPTENDLIKAS